MVDISKVRDQLKSRLETLNQRIGEDKLLRNRSQLHTPAQHLPE